MAYKKCPRCNLNYVKDTDLLCKICLEEVGKALRSNDEEDEYDICPECGEQIIKAGEEMCTQCLVEQNKDEVDPPKKKDDDWEKVSDEEDDEEELYESETQDLTEIDLDEEIEEEE